MIQTVWKFPLALAQTQDVLMPAGARILSIQVQDEMLCAWALVNPEADRERRYFLIVGIGHEMPKGRYTYLATVQMDSFVWHVFERETKMIGV